MEIRFKPKILIIVVIFELLVGVVISSLIDLKLPYEKGETHQLTCGYGCGGHIGEDYYALDFSQLKSRNPFKFY